MKKKLQKKVDSVGWLCYSKDKSFENVYLHSVVYTPENAETATIPPADFVKNGENQGEF